VRKVAIDLICSIVCRSIYGNVDNTATNWQKTVIFGRTAKFSK
jgi:hypothetical protein